MRRRSHAGSPWLRAIATSALVAGALATGTGCGHEETPDNGPTLSVAAEDLSLFTEPRDAVPMDDGSIAFLARQNHSALEDADPEEGAAAALADRYAVWVMAKGEAPKPIAAPTVAPFNIAAAGDTLWVADLGAGAEGGGALLKMSRAGDATLVAEEYRPQGVAVGPDGKVYFTGRDPASGEPGVFVLEGDSPRAMVTGGMMKSPSGLDVAEDGTIYVADAAAASEVDDAQVTGSGHGVVFQIVERTVTVVSAGFHAGYPTGIALSGSKIAVSVYAHRETQSAILWIDRHDPTNTVLTTKSLEGIDRSAGLHQSKGRMVWSGGNAVYLVNL